MVICAENRPDYPIAEVALMAMPSGPSAHLHHQHHRGSCPHPARFRRASRDRVIRSARRSQCAKLATRPEGSIFCWKWEVRQWARDARAITLPPDDIMRDAATIPPTAMACLIYTSGTGGTPRGVMLPHRCILSNCRGAFELVRPLRLKDEVYLSYLPMSHSYEHTVGNFFFASLGTEIVYSRGVGASRRGYAR